MNYSVVQKRSWPLVPAAQPRFYLLRTLCWDNTLTDLMLLSRRILHPCDFYPEQLQILSLLLLLGSSVPHGKSRFSQAHAYNYFDVTNGVGTRIALVAEQIVPAPIAGLPSSYGLDY